MTTKAKTAKGTTGALDKALAAIRAEVLAQNYSPVTERLLDSIGGPLPFGVPFDEPLTRIVAHLVGQGADPDCIAVRLLNPGVLTDWKTRPHFAEVGAPSGPVSGIIPDATNPGHYIAVKSDDSKRAPMEGDLTEALPFIRRDVSSHFERFPLDVKKAYINRLVTVGHDPKFWGVPTSIE